MSFQVKTKIYPHEYFAFDSGIGENLGERVFGIYSEASLRTPI